MKKIKLPLEKLFLTILVGLYVVAAASVSINRYWQYNAFWYDFGILDTTIWRLSRFSLPIIEQLKPPLGLIVWADHFNPSIILYAPFYWLSSKQELMLITQAAAVGLSAIIAYIIAKKATKSVLIGGVLTFAYLGFVGLQNALFTDIHNIVFSLPFLMLTFWATFEKKWKLYWLFFIITLGFQESLAGLGFTLGIYILLRKDKNIKVGLITLLISVIWGVVSLKLIIPHFLGYSYKYSPDFPAHWYGWITSFFIPFIKLRTIFLTFATFGFLPLFSLSSLPMIVEHYLERFVLNQAATRWDLGFHYNALLSPIMFISSLEAIMLLKNSKIMKKILPYWMLLIAILVFFLHRFYLHGPLMLATHPVFYKNTQDAAFLDKFVRLIPQNGLLMTQNNLAAHFTHDKVILPNLNFETIKPDYIAFDTRPGQNGNNFFPLTPYQFNLLVASVSASPDYKIQKITDSQLIFTRIN